LALTWAFLGILSQHLKDSSREFQGARGRARRKARKTREPGKKLGGILHQRFYFTLVLLALLLALTWAFLGILSQHLKDSFRGFQGARGRIRSHVRSTKGPFK